MGQPSAAVLVRALATHVANSINQDAIQLLTAPNLWKMGKRRADCLNTSAAVGAVPEVVQNMIAMALYWFERMTPDGDFDDEHQLIAAGVGQVTDQSNVRQQRIGGRPENEHEGGADPKSPKDAESAPRITAQQKREVAAEVAAPPYTQAFKRGVLAGNTELPLEEGVPEQEQ